MADEIENVEHDAIELEARAVGLTRDEFLKLRADLHRMWQPHANAEIRAVEEAQAKPAKADLPNLAPVDEPKAPEAE